MESTLKKIIIILVIIIAILLIALVGITIWNKMPRKTKTSYEKVAVYFWTCRGDKKHESVMETKVIGVEIDDNADYVIDAGTYEIKYVNKGKEISPKVTRTYKVTVIDFYTNKLDELGAVTYEYQAQPGPYPTEITVSKGQYIYIQHTANENAKDGNLYLIGK